MQAETSSSKTKGRRTVRRLGSAIAIAAVLCLAATQSVAAKMPYFTVEVEPAAPIAGEPFVVVVRTWEDLEHSRPAGFGAGELSGLLVARAANGDSPNVAIPLLLREPDRYEASLILPAGDWTIVAFPDRSGWSSPTVPVGYPDTIPLVVREPGSGQTALVAAFLIVAPVILAIGLGRRHLVAKPPGAAVP